MEARDHSRLFQMQMQAQSAAAGAQPNSLFYQHFRPPPSFPLHPPSPLQQQQQQPINHHHHHQQQQHQEHLPINQQQQQQQQQQQHQEHHEQPQGQEQEQQQQQQQPPQQQPQHQHMYPHFLHHQQQDASKTAVNPSIVHGQQHLDANLNPSVSSGYYPETPPAHMSPHQLQTTVSSPTCIGTGGNVGASMSLAMVLSQSDPVVKKKRGRPRKYVTDSNGTASPLMSASAPSTGEKKGGRGSNKKAQLCIPGTTGQGFTPYVLTIGAGEDVTAKVTTFAQHGPWAVCILSANGAISNASLWHAGMTSGSVTYEGRFEILSLSGVFLLTEEAATGGRTGGLSVSLAGQDGRVIGGRVAGLLVAATPIQVVMGTFFQMSRKSQVRAEAASSMPPVEGATTQPAPTTMPIGDEASTDACIAVLQDEQNTGPPLPVLDVPKVEQQVSQGMPLQSAEWGGHHFDESHGERQI